MRFSDLSPQEQREIYQEVEHNVYQAMIAFKEAEIQSLKAMQQILPSSNPTPGFLNNNLNYRFEPTSPVPTPKEEKPPKKRVEGVSLQSILSGEYNGSNTNQRPEPASDLGELGFYL